MIGGFGIWEVRATRRVVVVVGAAVGAVRVGARRRRRAVSRGVASSKDDAFEGCTVNR